MRDEYVQDGSRDFPDFRFGHHRGKLLNELSGNQFENSRLEKEPLANLPEIVRQLNLVRQEREQKETYAGLTEEDSFLVKWSTGMTKTCRLAHRCKYGKGRLTTNLRSDQPAPHVFAAVPASAHVQELRDYLESVRIDVDHLHFHLVTDCLRPRMMCLPILL